MATSTLGTTANNSLTSLINAGAMTVADLATIANSILNDQINTFGHNPIFPGAYAQNGLLYVPNRGVLKVLPGDYVGVDSAGWPVLVSANSIAHAAWTHT
jgi:hypothetical protein